VQERDGIFRKLRENQEEWILDMKSVRDKFGIIEVYVILKSRGKTHVFLCV